MFIHEAINSLTAAKPFITRRSWAYVTQDPVPAAIRILPTDSPDCCVVISAYSKIPCPRWQPQAEDLVADDWEVVGG